MRWLVRWCGARRAARACAGWCCRRHAWFCRGPWCSLQGAALSDVRETEQVERGLLCAGRAGSERPRDGRARQDPRHAKLDLRSDPELMRRRTAVDRCVTRRSCHQRVASRNPPLLLQLRHWLSRARQLCVCRGTIAPQNNYRGYTASVRGILMLLSASARYAGNAGSRCSIRFAASPDDATAALHSSATQVYPPV